MNGELHFFPAGDAAILAVLGEGISEEVNDRVRQLYRAVCDAKAPQVVEAVPSYTSVLVHYRPELASYAEMKALLSSLYDPAAAAAAAQPRTFLIPVCYGLHFGPDLWEMQETLGLSRQEIIDIHSGRDYRVYMMGFLPGFVYLGGMDERIAYPRLKKPRLHIDAGAVGIAGGQTGVYPSDSPGGWRIIGRTPIRMFDPSADPPAPVSPGDLVRFVPISVDEYYGLRRQEQKKGARQQAAQGGSGSAFRLKVLTAGPLSTVQDGGRFGGQASGMTESGAMDRGSLRLANRLLGNEENAAALELTLFGGSFEIEGEGRIALTGADMQAKINGQSVPMNEAVAVRDGDKLELGAAVKGVRTYLAVPGGIAVPEVLGSRSTNLKAGIGGLEGCKLRAGDVLYAASHSVPGTVCCPDPSEGPKTPQNGAESPVPVLRRLAEKTDAEGVTEIRFLFGPQDDRFSEEAKRIFTQSVYTISQASDRMGYRLDGPAVEAEGGTDILSDGICFGSIQIPSDGKPIVMMADHQTTGGYAKIGTVITSDLPLLAQLGPGRKIRFREAQK